MRIVTLTAMALVLGSLPLLAQESVAPMAPPAPPAMDFADADADGDGAVSPDEWRSYVTARAQARRDARLDAHVEWLFTAGDADGNDALDRGEMRAALASVADEMRGRMGERGERGGRYGGWSGHGYGHGHGHGHGWSRGWSEGWGQGWGDRDGDDEGRGTWRRGDGNGDGPGDGQGYGRGARDWGADMERFAERGFGRIDRDDDGLLSAEEFEAARERMQERWAERMERRARAAD